MSIVTKFDTFKVNEEDVETPAPAPAEDPAAEPAAAPEETPAEEPKAEEAPKEEVKADEPQAEEHEYYFTWYGWVPSYGDFDQDWMSVKAKSDSEAIEKLSEYKPLQYSKGGVGLDTLDGEKPKGASVVDGTNKKMVLKLQNLMK